MLIFVAGFNAADTATTTRNSSRAGDSGTLHYTPSTTMELTNDPNSNPGRTDDSDSELELYTIPSSSSKLSLSLSINPNFPI